MKLIDLLVKELPRRGGWPEGALNATQDKDGEVCFSSGAVPEFGYAAWEGGDWCGNEFHTIRADDYDTAIITHAQYEAALAASDGWIEWHGGDCPVDSEAIIEVKFRWHNQRQYNNDRAGDFDWAHIGRNSDIIAYRLHKPDAKSRANDDRLENDLNECIGQSVAAEWDGEGLPPAGVECEARYRNANAEWAFFRCVVVDCGVAFGWSGKEAVTLGIDSYEFRPLRTEAEKVREAEVNELIDAINITLADIYASRVFMEAIAAGKIPGVKPEVK